RSTATPTPSQALCQSATVEPAGAGGVMMSHRSGRTHTAIPSPCGFLSESEPPGDCGPLMAMRPMAGSVVRRADAIAPNSAVRPRSAASSTISNISGPNTRILRIKHVRAHDLDTEARIVHRRNAEHPLPDALAPVRQQREPNPTFELDRRRGGG